MGYLDSTSVTVDAVLTKKGREILSRGGNLDIGSFTLSDTGVDYTLWNTDHPSGSAFYGEAIENLPMLEASVHAKNSIRNRLITLNQDAIAIPAIEPSATGMTSANLIKFDDTSYPQGITVNFLLKGYSVGTGDLIVVVMRPDLFNSNLTFDRELQGVTRDFLDYTDISRARQMTMKLVNGEANARFMPIVQADGVLGKQSAIIVIHPESGATAEVFLENNVTKITRQLLSNTTTKG